MSSMIWAAARVSRQKRGSVTMDTTLVTEYAAAVRFVKQIFCTKRFTVPARTPLNSGRCCWLLIEQLRKPSQLSAEALQELTSNGGRQSCLCTESIPLQFLQSTAQGVHPFCNVCHTKLLQCCISCLQSWPANLATAAVNGFLDCPPAAASRFGALAENVKLDAARPRSVCGPRLRC